MNYNLFRNVLHGKQYESPSVDKMSKSFQLNCDGFLEVSKKMVCKIKVKYRFGNFKLDLRVIISMSPWIIDFCWYYRSVGSK